MSEAPTPATTAGLIGHAAAERAWLAAWRAGRLPHAWLLTGPRGVGKATLAYRLARAYLAGLDAEPAWHNPTAPIFRMVANHAHPDLTVIEPRIGRQGPIEQKVEIVREALEDLYRTSSHGRRACVIDEADVTLNRHGENSLLKVLEEPPAGLVFLLVAQRPGRLLPTIPSRCTTLRLAPLSAEQVRAGLERLAPNMAEAEAPRLAELAEGSIGRALALRALDWEGGYGALLTGFAAASDEAGRLRAALALLRLFEKAGFATAVTYLGLLLRRLAHASLGRLPERELCQDEAARLSALAGAGTLDRWLAMWEKLAALAERVEAVNLDPAQALLQIAHGICSPEAEPAAGAA